MSIIGKFQDSGGIAATTVRYNQQVAMGSGGYNPQGPVGTGPVQPQYDPTMPQPVLSDGRTAEGLEALRQIKSYDYQTSPTLVPQANTTINAQGVNFGRGGRPYYSSTFSTADGQTMNLAGRGGDITSEESAAQAMEAIDAPFRAANTVIAGTIMGLNNPQTVIDAFNERANFSDGVSLGDMTAYFSKVWDSKITPGQAIANTVAVNLKRFNEMVLDNVLAADTQLALDTIIDTETAKALADPANERGLGSWLSALHSDFNIYDETQRDSAFNQGLGRWITGAADAAILWWAGIDVLTVKGVSVGYKAATTKVLGQAGRRGGISFDEFETRVIQHQFGGKATAEGELVDTIYRMTPEQASHHDLVLNSSNPALAARLFGATFTSRQQAMDVFLAAAGSVKHARRLRQTRSDLYDNLLHAGEELEQVKWNLRVDREAAADLGDDYARIFGTDIRGEIDHYQALVDDAIEQLKPMNPVGAPRVGEEANDAWGILVGTQGDDVSLNAIIGQGGRGMKGRGLRYDTRVGARTRRSALGMENRAVRRMDRFSGTAYTHYTFKIPGMSRNFRLIATARSAMNYIGTHRQKGVLDFNDPVEFMREFRAALETAPFLRKAARGVGAERNITRTLDDGTEVVETVEQFRTRMLQAAERASVSSPEQKAKFAESFELEMAEALGQHLSTKYGIPISKATMVDIAREYMTKRSIVRGWIKDHNWLKNDDELVILDDLTLSTQRNGYTLMDFKWLERSIRLHYSSSAVKKSSAAAVRGLTWLDYVWRPLVLLRLGYTQRNLAEGYLRSMAAWGEVPGVDTISKSSRNLFMNTGDRVAGGVNRVRNYGFKRRGLRRVRKQMNAARGTMQRDIEVRNNAQDNLNRANSSLRAQRKAARRQAEEEYLRRTQSAMQAFERPVYDQISDDLTEAQLRMLDTADTLIYNTDDVTAVAARGLIEPDPATGAGVADAEAIVRTRMGDEAEQIGDGFDDAAAYDFMTPTQRREYDDIVAREYSEMPDEQGQIVYSWATAEGRARADELLRRGYIRRVNQLARRDYRIGRIDDTGQFRVVRSSSFDNLSLDEFRGGLIVAVPKSVKPQYAKVDVYGGVLDLRTNVAAETLRVREEVSVARSAMNRFDDFNKSGPENYTFSEGADLTARLNESLQSLFGDPVPVAADDVEAALRLLETNPEVLRGIALKRWLDANADRLPEGFIEWATKNRLILTNPELTRLIRATKRLDAEAGKVGLRYQELRAWLNNPDNWPNGSSLHAGRLIENNVLTDVLIDPRTLGYAHGPGLYSIEGAPNTSKGYLFAHVDGQADIDRARLAADAEPIVYIMPDPNGYSWIDLDAPVMLGGSPSSQFEDLIQILDTPEFSISGSSETLGQFLRYSVASDPSSFSTMGRVYAQVRSMAASGQIGKNPSIEVRVPRRFFEDHMARLDEQELSGVKIVREQKNSVVVSLDSNSFRNMLSDARFYSDRSMRSELAPENRAVVDSAARTVRALEGFEAQFSAATNESVLYDIIDALRRGGYDGLTHKTGGEGEGVYIWWTKDLPLTRLDDVSDSALEMMNLARRGRELRRQFADAVVARGRVERSAPYGSDTMRITSPRPGGGFIANAKLEELLVKYARERGYGKVLIDDPSTLEGHRALFVPDMMATNQGFLDGLIPGQVAAAGRGKVTVADLSKNSPTRAALESFDPSIAKTVFRGGNLSRQGKARLVIFMQQMGYTHMLVPAGRGKEPVLMSASEILGDTLTGLAYVRLGLKDEIDELTASILAKSPEYAKATGDLADAQRNVMAAGVRVKATQDMLRDLGSTLDRIRPRQKRTVATGSVGGTEARRGQEGERLTFSGPQGRLSVETGEVLDPNEALSGIAMGHLSSGSFHDLLAVGYMQNRYSQYQRSLHFREYSPADSDYWLAMSNLTNDLIRQDPVLRRLIALPRIDRANPDQVAAQNRVLMEQLNQDDRFRTAIRQGIYDPSTLDVHINDMRDKLYSWLPDVNVSAQAARRPLTPDYLQAKLAWRDDLVSIQEKDLVKVDNLYARFVNRGMTALGTVPEDTMLRVPFYRKRWSDEMQRQVAEYESVGVTELSQGQIDTMRQVAHSFALQETRRTFYTVTRLSTPAAALGFIIPFFPAWENALRFWTREFATRPENAVRYGMVFNAPASMGMVVDEDGNPIQAKHGIFGLPEALFAPEGAYLQFFIPEGVANALDKLPLVGAGTKGEVRISLSALNVALQGDYPWLTNLGPAASVPLNVIAAQAPDYVDALVKFEAGGIPIGDSIARVGIPFARPTAEKNILSVAYNSFTPGSAKYVITAVTGWGDAQYVGTVEEIRRDMTIDWERQGKPEGMEPTLDEANARAREFYALRVVTALTAFAQPSWQSKYQGYIEEWRRIEEKHRAIEESYKTFNIPVPEDAPVGYQAALREFLDLHGPAMFYLTQSSSGRSGIGASVDEYDILKKHGQLAGKLAGDGTDDFVAMITSPYQGEFSQPVYAWQMNRAFDNSTVLMRGGDPEDVIRKGEISRGWIRYIDAMNELEALMEEAGFTDFEQSGAEVFKDMKKLLESDIARDNPEWFAQKEKFDQGEWRRAVSSVETILNDEKFMNAHGSEPLWVDVRDWYDARAEIGQILLDRKRTLGDEGSSNINAVSNADVKMSWDIFIAERKRKNIAFAEFYNRFLDYDTLLPGEPWESLVLSSEYVQPPAAQEPIVIPGDPGARSVVGGS